MKKSILLLVGVCIHSLTFAQTPTLVAAIDTPSFIAAVLAGLIIAIGFQFLLTMLSAAVGISAVGNVKKNYVSGKHDLSQEDQDNDNNDDSSSSNVGLKIISGLGAWNLFTTTIALFGATAIALVLSPIDVVSVKIALALCIWAAFYLFIFVLEYKVASGLIGGLVRTAMAGIKSSGEALGSMFQPSPDTKLEKTLDHTIEKVRDEFEVNINLDEINSTLDKHLTEIKENSPSYDQIKSDLAALLKDSSGKPSPVKWTAIQGMLNKVIDAKSSDNSEKTKAKIGQLKSVINEIKEASSSGDTMEEKIEGILKATPIDNEKVDTLMSKVKDAIFTESSIYSDSNSIQKKVESVLFSSQNSWQEIQASIKNLDRESVKDLFRENTSLENEQMEQYIDKAFDAITTVKERVGITNNDQMTPNLLESLETRVQEFIDTTDSPALNYDVLRSDLYKIWNNPKDSLQVIKKRLDTFDNDTIVSLLTNNQYVDREDIDKLTLQFEETKKSVLDHVNQIETTARQKLSMLEKKAVIHAENTRKIAATAAWWLVFTIIISGGAAIGGSFLTL